MSLEVDEGFVAVSSAVKHRANVASLQFDNGARLSVVPGEGVRFYPDWTRDQGGGLPRGHIGSPYYVSLSLEYRSLVVQPGGGIVLHDEEGARARLYLLEDGQLSIPGAA